MYGWPRLSNNSPVWRTKYKNEDAFRLMAGKMAKWLGDDLEEVVVDELDQKEGCPVGFVEIATRFLAMQAKRYCDMPVL